MAKFKKKRKKIYRPTHSSEYMEFLRKQRDALIYKADAKGKELIAKAYDITLNP